MEAERKMKVERERQEELVQQMKMKFEEEKRLQQEELCKALESKLAEQKVLQEKGFKERALQKDEEIEQLRKEMEDHRRSEGIKEIVLPLVTAGKELFSNVLHYKLEKKKAKYQSNSFNNNDTNKKKPNTS